jgi:hypothetical protein
VGIYELNKRITLSGTWVYGTGNALTIPVSSYNASQHLGNINFRQQGQQAVAQPLSYSLFSLYPSVQEFGEKNSFRAEPYHRLDLGIQFHKKMKRHERTWEFSVYNAYNRKNPFFYQIGSKYDQSKQVMKTSLNKYSIFPIIPSLSYNFKF